MSMFSYMLLIYDRYKLRWEQYKEYDPFLDGAGSTPSNPWISDDSTMWEINEPK